MLRTEMVTRADLERLEGWHTPCRKVDLEALRRQLRNQMIAYAPAREEFEALRREVAQCATQADLETLLRDEAINVRGDIRSAFKQVYAEPGPFSFRIQYR
jgi:hypothetical protein